MYKFQVVGDDSPNKRILCMGVRPGLVVAAALDAPPKILQFRVFTETRSQAPKFRILLQLRPLQVLTNSTQPIETKCTPSPPKICVGRKVRFHRGCPASLRRICIAFAALAWIRDKLFMAVLQQKCEGFLSLRNGFSSGRVRNSNICCLYLLPGSGSASKYHNPARTSVVLNDMGSEFRL